jgi:hypothetical protein
MKSITQLGKKQWRNGRKVISGNWRKLAADKGGTAEKVKDSEKVKSPEGAQ